MFFIGSGDSARASVHRRLATLERAGIPLLVGVRKVVERGGEGRVLEPVLAALEAQEDVATAFARAPGFSPLERRVIAAAERSGTLPESLDQLAHIFDERAKAKQALLFATAYPLFLLHAAVFLPALPELFKSGLGGFAKAVLIPLGTLYGVAIASVFVFRAARRAQPAAVDRLVLSVPLVNTLERSRSLAIALRALGVLYGNGIPIDQALEAAADICPNAYLAGAFTRVRDSLKEGLEIAEAFALEEGVLPHDIVDLIQTGATTGQLDAQLAYAREQLDLKARQTRAALIGILSVGSFLAVAAYIGYTVISFYSNYLNQALNAAGGR